MYAVIFKAEMNELSDNDTEIYMKMAKELRTLARQEYACIEFNSVLEDRQEISISYWENLEQIKHWRQNYKHLIAQEFGRIKAYKSYQVQVVEVLREYNN